MVNDNSLDPLTNKLKDREGVGEVVELVVCLDVTREDVEFAMAILANKPVAPLALLLVAN